MAGYAVDVNGETRAKRAHVRLRGDDCRREGIRDMTAKAFSGDSERGSVKQESKQKIVHFCVQMIVSRREDGSRQDKLFPV